MQSLLILFAQAGFADVDLSLRQVVDAVLKMAEGESPEVAVAALCHAQDVCSETEGGLGESARDRMRVAACGVIV